MDFWNKTYEHLYPIIKSFGYGVFMSFLERVIINGPSYSRQRKYFDDGFEAIVQHLVKEHENDQPDWRDT